MCKFRKVTLSDGTIKLKIVQESSEKIEERREIHKEREREYRKRIHSTTPEERFKQKFWKNVDKKNDDECWNWLGYTTWDGYGKIKHNRKTMKSHKVAYILSHKEVSKDMYVIHTCDNRLCCNPNHLKEGTHQENMRDMVNRDRCPRAKLTKKQVDEIREKYKNGMSISELAKEYNVDSSNISRIVKNITWINNQK